MWTVNFQMLKVVLEKAEEPHQIAICWIMEKAREFQKNIYFCCIDYATAFVWITINCGKFFKRWEYQTTCLLRNLYAGQEAIVRTGHGKTDWFTIALISHANKVMLKILQARFQQYVNRELPDVQASFRKGRGTRIKLPTSTGSWKKQESSRKHLFLLYWLCQSLWLCGSQ